MCMSSNQGGIMGNRDMGSTFLWVKLKSNTVPKAYPVSGLKPSQFAASNDLYGSFCRVRVTLQSDDKKIQDVIAKGTDWATAYFAAGDTFTCGSWIPGKALEQLADAVAKDARADASVGDTRMRNWMAVLGTVGGGGLGAVAGNKIADSSFLGGLTGGATKSSQEYVESCYNYGTKYFQLSDQESKSSALTKMISSARKINTNKKVAGADKDTLNEAIENLLTAMRTNGGYTTGATTGTSVACKFAIGAPAAVKVTVENSPVSIKSAKYTCPESGNSTLTNSTCTPNEQNIEMTGTASVGVLMNNPEVTEVTVIYCPENSGITPADINSYTYNGMGTNGETVNIAKGQAQTATANASNISTAVTALQAECGKWDDKGTSAQKTKSISTAIGTGVGAIAGGVLAYQATKSVQESKLDKVEQAAYDEWMNEVGNHIRCFVGGDEVGQYGDIISTSME